MHFGVPAEIGENRRIDAIGDIFSRLERNCQFEQTFLLIISVIDDLNLLLTGENGNADESKNGKSNKRRDSHKKGTVFRDKFHV
jgi:hypothetical protein